MSGMTDSMDPIRRLFSPRFHHECPLMTFLVNYSIRVRCRSIALSGCGADRLLPQLLPRYLISFPHDPTHSHILIFVDERYKSIEFEIAEEIGLHLT